MRNSAPHRLIERRRAILRQASDALRGRFVTLWRVGRELAVAEGASQVELPRHVLELDVPATLRMWGRAVVEGSLWLLCPLNPSRWDVAPVRSEVPPPSPTGVERRSPERLVLEVTGVVLGALERVWAVADQKAAYLCTALAVLDVSLARLRDPRVLSTGARARLLADLAIISESIERALQRQ